MSLFSQEFWSYDFVKLAKSCHNPKEQMEIKFGITCTKRSVYNHLKRANLVWVSARSKHPKGDLDKQEVFKKNLKLK